MKIYYCITLFSFIYFPTSNFHRFRQNIYIPNNKINSSIIDGTFKRDGSNVKLFFTDAVNNGAVNFVIWDIDILSKSVEVRYWEIDKAE
jgi:hypothetical protein